MGGTQSVDFGVALDKASYCGGETINGYVQVKVLTKDAKMPEHMSVSLVGKAHTAVRYTKTTGTGKNKKRKRKTAYQTENLLNLVAKVGNIDESQLVEGAQLQCPFSFEIPANALSSMKYGSGSNRGEIKYQLSIFSKVPGKLYGVSTTCLHSVAVDIVAAPPQPTANPPSVEDFVSVTRCCCIPAGTMELAASSSVSAITAGDQPVVSFSVDNKSSQNVSYIDVSVTQIVKVYAKGHQHSVTKTIASSRMAGVARGAAFGFEKSSSDGPRIATLQVPDFTYSSTDSPTVKVICFIKVKAKTESAFVRDPEVSIPIKTYRQSVTVAEVLADEADSGGEDDPDSDDEGGGDKAEDLVATVVSIEYAPNPEFVVQSIEAPIQATVIS